MEVSINGETPIAGWFMITYHGKCKHKMNYSIWYRYFRTPPFTNDLSETKRGLSYAKLPVRRVIEWINGKDINLQNDSSPRPESKSTIWLFGSIWYKYLLSSDMIFPCFPIKTSVKTGMCRQDMPGHQTPAISQNLMCSDENGISWGLNGLNGTP